MPQITVKVLIRGDGGQTEEYRHSIQVEKECTEKGGEAFASELFEYVGAELTWHKRREELRPIEDLLACPEQILQELLPAAMSNMNRQELWREIRNTLYDIVHSLAQAKAYKDIEPQVAPEQCYSAHSRKTAHLNIAALYLAKIQDLAVRLLFESFGGTAFIPVNTLDEDWERALTMTNAHKALRRLRAESTLDAAEFEAIVNALNEPSKSCNKEVVVRYRNCVAHRVRPSVDHWELSPVLQNREGTAILDDNGNQNGVSWAFVRTS